MPSADEPSRTEITKNLLLESAIHAFAERGFHGTSTRDITAAAGKSSAALYVHHKSKEDLLYLISRAGHEATLEMMRAGRAKGDEHAEKLRIVVRDFVVDHARNHTRSRIVNFELAALAPAHLDEVRRLRKEIDEELTGLIRDGNEAGVFDAPNPHTAALAVLSLGIDVARWYFDGYRVTPEQLASEYADIALRIVGARSAQGLPIS